MSEENAELVRRRTEAALRRPEPDWATINELYHPNHEFVPLASFFEGGSHRGTSGYRDWLLKTEDFLEWEARVERVTEIDTDHVLAITPIKVRGKSSGVALREERVASVVTVRGGKIVRTQLYPSPEEALKAVELER